MLQNNNRRRIETPRSRAERLNEQTRERLAREDASRAVAERMRQIQEEQERTLSPEAQEELNRIRESNTSPRQWTNRPQQEPSPRLPQDYVSRNEEANRYEPRPSSAREPRLFSNYFYTGVPIISPNEEQKTRLIKGVLIMTLSDNMEYYVPTRMRVTFTRNTTQEEMDEQFQANQSEWIQRRLSQDVPKALNENKVTFTNIKGTFSKTLEGVKMRVINTTSIQSLDIMLEEEFLRLYHPRGQLGQTFSKISNPLE